MRFATSTPRASTHAHPFPTTYPCAHTPNEKQKQVKILPDEITDTLRVLQDKNPGEPFEDVCRVIQQDFGTPLGELFASFEVRVVV